VPTVVLADSTGRPYTIITGYDRGGQSAFLELVRNSLAIKHKRDAFFASADLTVSVDRVQKLHEALQVVDPALGSMDVRGDDPLLVFYMSVVREILDSGDTKAREIR